MKRMLFIFLFAAAMLTGADLSGRWDGPTDLKNGSGGPVVVHVQLKQDGARISGGVWIDDHDEDNPRPIQNGSLDGTKLRFTVPQKADSVVTFDLELKDDILDGVIRFQGPNGPQEIKVSFKRLPVR